jgi:hypothetical protein
MRTLKGLRRAIAALALVTHLPACVHTWQPTDLHPAALVADQQVQQLRVTTNDGERIVVRAPSIARDSLRGERVRFEIEAGRFVERRTPVVIALADVTRVEQLATSAGGTALAIAIPITALGLLGLLACDPKTNYVCPR